MNLASSYSTTMVHGTWKIFNQTHPSPQKKNLATVLLYQMGLRKSQLTLGFIREIMKALYYKLKNKGFVGIQ